MIVPESQQQQEEKAEEGENSEGVKTQQENKPKDLGVPKRKPEEEDSEPKWSLVIVEGGPKSLRRYKKLMLRRIKWNAKKKLRRKLKMSIKMTPTNPKINSEEVPFVI